MATLTIPPWLYLERYRNEGTRTYSVHAAYTECRRGYRPQDGSESFGLPTWELARDVAQIFQADPSPELAQVIFPRPDTTRFYVHPQVVEECGHDPYLQRTHALGLPCPPTRVSPTASTRTVHVVGESPAHALKVHFPFRVSRYGRRMRSEVVEQAVAVSSALQAWSDLAGGRFAFLREVIGVSHRPDEADGERGENWGFVVRDQIPFPPVADERSLVPGFALYGKDAHDEALPPLLLELADANDPAGWTLERVLLPTIRHWVGCFRDLGFILEPHGQNVLLEVDAGGEATRLVHRDLSVGIDMRRRQDRGLDDGRLNGYNRFEDGAFASVAYDRFMGTHFFEVLLRPLLDAERGLAMEYFRSACRDEFERLFPDHEGYLPRTVHYFSEERDAYGKPHVEDTGRPPSWRP